MDDPTKPQDQNARPPQEPDQPQTIGKVPATSFFTVRATDPKFPKPYVKTTITLGAWAMLIIFSSAAACALCMVLMLKDKMLYGDASPVAGTAEPFIRNLLEGYYEFLGWSTFIVFFLSAVGSLGMLRRKLWSLKLLQRLSYIWCALAIAFMIWWAGAAWGVIRAESPINMAGLLLCLVSFGVSWALNRFLTFNQVKVGFTKGKPQKLSFMPGIMMLPAE